MGCLRRHGHKLPHNRQAPVAEAAQASVTHRLNIGLGIAGGFCHSLAQAFTADLVSVAGKPTIGRWVAVVGRVGPTIASQTTVRRLNFPNQASLIVSQAGPVFFTITQRRRWRQCLTTIGDFRECCFLRQFLTSDCGQSGKGQRRDRHSDSVKHHRYSPDRAISLSPGSIQISSGIPPSRAAAGIGLFEVHAQPLSVNVKSRV